MKSAKLGFVLEVFPYITLDLQDQDEPDGNILFISI